MSENIYLSGSLPKLFAKTAAPIILVMLVNGLFAIVDAYFLGAYVGADALVAVTLMFPVYMFMIALSTLVSAGFSSLYARLLGAGEKTQARQVFVESLSLALVICVGLIGSFLVFGESVSLWIANGSEGLAAMGRLYIGIMFSFAPLMFVLGINIDALRAEGLLGAMAGITLASACMNIAFDYLFIVQFQFGIAGSAYGTVLAQACAFTAVMVFRSFGSARFSFARPRFSRAYWRRLLALGMPSSFGYIGLSLSTLATLYSLQIWAGDGYTATAGAFGIISRLMTFMFLPLLGISMAFQTIVGNNFGAELWPRVNRVVVLAMVLSFAYCVLAQVFFFASASWIGGVFVEDTAIIAEVARILPIQMLLLFTFGPVMMLATYFQAIGDVARAMVLELTRTYLFGIPLVLVLPFWVGEVGIWYSGVVAGGLMVLLAGAVLMHRARSGRYRLGLFMR